MGRAFRWTDQIRDVQKFILLSYLLSIAAAGPLDGQMFPRGQPAGRGKNVAKLKTMSLSLFVLTFLFLLFCVDSSVFLLGWITLFIAFVFHNSHVYLSMNHLSFLLPPSFCLFFLFTFPLVSIFFRFLLLLFGLPHLYYIYSFLPCSCHYCWIFSIFFLWLSHFLRIMRRATHKWHNSHNFHTEFIALKISSYHLLYSCPSLPLFSSFFSYYLCPTEC